MRSTHTLGPTERRRDSAAPIRGHRAGTSDGNGAGSDAQAPVGRRLSDFIVSEGFVSAEHLAPALAEQKKTGERLADVPSELLRLVPSAIARKHEVIPIGRSAGALTLVIVHGARPAEICKAARDQGMRTLREAGLAKVLEGVTTLEEVLRVTSE